MFAAIRSAADSLPGRRYLRMTIAALLVVATFALYRPVGSHPFISYDDPLYVTGSVRVQAGLSVEGVRWALTSFDAANWHPVTWLSHMADVTFFGMDAGMHHRVNVLFHASNVVILFLLLSRLTGSLFRSALVSALFALHPMHVQSVAWVAERKDVLSTFFGLLALSAWAWYAGRPCVRRYLAVGILLALGLMSKPMLVTFPFLMLLMDFWPLGRFPVSGEDRFDGSVFRRLAGEKVPLLFLVACSTVLTFAAQKAGGTVVDLTSFSLTGRVANVMVSYARYLWKAIWPESLSIFYPLKEAGAPAWQAFGALALLAGAAVLSWRQRRHRPWLLFGSAWFLVTLVPVIGFVQVGGQAMADRYAYVPFLGLYVIFAWGLAEISGRLKTGRAAVASMAVILLLTLAAVSRGEIGRWKSDASLFGRALEVTDENWLAHYNLGVLEGKAGNDREAEAHYRETLRISPDHAYARLNMGELLFRQGRLGEAAGHLLEAIRIRPEMAEAWNDLGLVLAAERRYAEAVDRYLEAIRLKPDYADAFSNLGVALEGAGDPDGAMARYREAIRLKPDGAGAHNNLGFLLGRLGRLEEAAGHLREAVRLAPENPEARNNLGIALLLKGDPDAAAVQFAEALRARPDDPQARANLEKAQAASRARGESGDR